MNKSTAGTYCGQMRNLVVFSTHNQLYVTFQTLKRTAQVFNRGFFGVYEFSEDYVKLGKPLGWAGPQSDEFILFSDFIQNTDAEHIRGTECDQKILSKRESSGHVFSPNYPFPYQVRNFPNDPDIHKTQNAFYSFRIEHETLVGLMVDVPTLPITVPDICI